MYGSGLPLGYLLLCSDGSEKGRKERYFRQFLTVICDKWHLDTVFTVTDKDWSEINACQAIFPDVKHQLCYWHCLRSVKTRLSILRRMPAHYNVDEAHMEFLWICSDFVPIRQQADPVSTFVIKCWVHLLLTVQSPIQHMLRHRKRYPQSGYASMATSSQSDRSFPPPISLPRMTRLKMPKLPTTCEHRWTKKPQTSK